LPSTKTADLAPHLIETKGKSGRPRPAAENEPMNFKVSPEFKRRFRIAAAERGVRLNELLIEAFEVWEAHRP
jgi:predicted HicB family RNase H-like nuclease